jgi:2,3-bisphosphoglycerate-dependent phosphoglycerate mutase
MYQFVIVRHGESSWNKENRFTGWCDVELSEKGQKEAQNGGKALFEQGYQFDMAFTSVLKRAIHTLDFILSELDQVWLPVQKHWRLNERHYGALQGLNKAETAAKHGDEQVKIWRRSYETPPPLIEVANEMHPSHDQRYKHIDTSELPRGESLEQTVRRVLPVWKNEIAPQIKNHKKVIIVAHGNSIRALVQYLEKLTPAQIMEVNIPTGTPLCYTLDKDFNFVRKEFIEKGKMS